MEYIVYDDVDDGDRSSSLIILTPFQQQLSAVVSRIIEQSTEALHSSIRNFLEKAGVFSDLQVVELEGLRGCYSSVHEFTSRMEGLFQKWTRTWKSKDPDHALSLFWEHFQSLITNTQLPSDAVRPQDHHPLFDFSKDSLSKKATILQRRKEMEIPLPDRPSLPDLSSVMRPNYPIGDAFDYQDWQPLIPNLKQPKQGKDSLKVSSESGARQNAISANSSFVEHSSNGSDDISRLGYQMLSDNVARSMLLKAIALEIGSAGFVAAQLHMIDVLVDVAIEQVQQWARRLKDGSLEMYLNSSDDGLINQILGFVRDRKDSPANPEIWTAIQSNNGNESDAKRPRFC